MTSDLRKLLIQAEDAIAVLSDNLRGGTVSEYYSELRARIDAALTEEVEPVAWQMPSGNLIANDSADTVGMWRIGGKPLYAAPADQDRADAERLDFLESMVQKGKVEIAKSILGTGYEVGHWKPNVSVQVTNGTLRDAIDRARSAK